MNREAWDFLTGDERTAILDDVDELLDDTNLSVAITYRDFQSVTHTLTTGAYVTVYTDIALRALRSLLSAHEVAAGPGLYQMGDLAFLVAQAHLGVTPVREDRIVLGADTYELVTWTAGPIGATWRLVARRVK